jgi:membrane protein
VLDRLRRRPAVAFALGLNDRFGEAGGGVLAASMALSMFLSLFPILLVAVAVLGFVAANDENLAADLVEELGLTGDVADLVTDSIEAAANSRVATSIVGFVGVVWASLGLAGSLSEVCNRPWQLRSRGMIGKAVAFVWLLGTLALFGGSILLTAVVDLLPGWAVVLEVLVGAGLVFGFFLFTLRLLTTKSIPLAVHRPGALVATAGVVVLNLLASLLLARQIAGATALYGSIGVVLGLLGWLLLFARLLVYGVVLNVVLHERAHGTIRVEVDAPRFAGEVSLRANRSGLVEPRQPPPSD